MLNRTHIIITLVSLTTTLVGCGGVDTMNPGSTGAGGAATSSSGGLGGGSTGTGPECMAPQQACGNVCMDISGDTANCGSCGHSCQGGACVASRCQPVTIATDQIQVGRIAVNSAGVYWGSKTVQGSAVMMYPAAGGALIPLVLGLDNNVNGLAVNAKNVYWTEQNSVATVPIGGGNVKPLATTMQPATGIAIDSTTVYWSEQFGGLSKVPIGGGSSVQLVPASSEGPAFPAVSGTSLFWVSLAVGGSTIKKISTPGGAVTVLAAGIDEGELVVDKSNVYWAGASTKQINAIPVGGGPVTVLGTTPYPPYGLAQDEEYLYISSNDAMGAILKMPKTGGEPQVIASGHGFVPSLAVDATSVYWASNDGMVLKVAK